MAFAFDPAALIKIARTQAGLSQRAMAARAGTSQSVVARIENRSTDPSGETLRRLLEAVGLELRCHLEPMPVLDSHMLEDVTRILAMTPEDRLLEVRNYTRLLAEARPAREDSHV